MTSQISVLSPGLKLSLASLQLASLQLASLQLASALLAGRLLSPREFTSLCETPDWLHGSGKYHQRFWLRSEISVRSN